MYILRLGARQLNKLSKIYIYERSVYIQRSLTTIQNNFHCHKTQLQSYSRSKLFSKSALTQSQYQSFLAMSEKCPAENKESLDTSKLSNKEKLKRAVKEYGSTVIVFHVTISLMSLGISYLIISSGVDVESLLHKLGLSSKSELAAGASTFVIAYAVHKVFAPARIGITLFSTPFIVRYLRRVGILKPPKTTGP